jgi:putative hydrolase of the HAD superfamily
MTMTKPSVLLFDLGGVLVDWAGNEPLLALTHGRLDPEAARKFWLESPAVRDFETGRCGAGEFATAVVAGLRLDCPPEDFLAQFESWDRGPFPGAAELLAELAPHYFLACLSNNNELHWRRLWRQHPHFLDRFHRLFASFEIGKIKPDPDIFEYVLAQLQVPPGAVLFFDDNIECVEAARRLGMRACQTKGVAAVRAALRAPSGATCL